MSSANEILKKFAELVAESGWESSSVQFNSVPELMQAMLQVAKSIREGREEGDKDAHVRTEKVTKQRLTCSRRFTERFFFSFSFFTHNTQTPTSDRCLLYSTGRKRMQHWLFFLICSN